MEDCQKTGKKGDGIESTKRERKEGNQKIIKSTKWKKKNWGLGEKRCKEGQMTEEKNRKQHLK